MKLRAVLHIPGAMYGLVDRGEVGCKVKRMFARRSLLGIFRTHPLLHSSRQQQQQQQQQQQTCTRTSTVA
jgi:hypothetical protein